MNLNFKQKTKIVCTIGPASGSRPKIRSLVQAGMSVARLNFSHGSHEAHAEYIRNIREVAVETGLPVAILQDLPGRKLRTGSLRDSQVKLKKDAVITLTTQSIVGDEQRLSVNLPTLSQDVRTGNEILLGDGDIQLKVTAVVGKDVQCRTVSGGRLKSRMGVTIPGVSLSGPFLTEEDKQHLLFGLEHQVDLVALSFVSRAEDVAEVRKFLQGKGKDIPLISKIERRQAVDNFEKILSLSDGIMVARGDLGLEIPLPQVPIVQKEIIRKCNHAGKPVITATQMLESMVHSPSPTRAEVTDVANAVLDGSDAIMLSAETSVGRFPIAATGMMCRIAEEAEATLPYERLLTQKGADLEPTTDDAISYGACHIAHQLRASAIVAFTFSGSTAWRVSKYRPGVPILALTPRADTRLKLALAWGVYPFQVEEPPTIKGLFTLAAKLAKELGVAKAGDLIIITAGIPLGVPGTTNLLKVERVA